MKEANYKTEGWVITITLAKHTLTKSCSLCRHSSRCSLIRGVTPSLATVAGTPPFTSFVRRRNSALEDRNEKPTNFNYFSIKWRLQKSLKVWKKTRARRVLLRVGLRKVSYGLVEWVELVMEVRGVVRGRASEYRIRYRYMYLWYYLSIFRTFPLIVSGSEHSAPFGSCFWFTWLCGGELRPHHPLTCHTLHTHTHTAPPGSQRPPICT